MPKRRRTRWATSRAPAPLADLRESIRKHWAPKADLDFLRKQLERRGADCKASDLAGFDQLHSGGLESTTRLIEWAEIERGVRVLDLGSGLGGTARCLAETIGCRVTALELSAELDGCARELTTIFGLEGKVDHRCGDLGEIDEVGVYDVVLLQHVDMHLPDKVDDYRRCRNWLKLDKKSRIIWHDWLAGSGGDLLLPVPWAAEGEEISFLSTEQRFRQDLAAADLVMTDFRDLSGETAQWFGKSQTKLKGVLEKVRGEEQARFERLLAEVEGVLANLAEKRLIPFFAKAVPRP